MATCLTHLRVAEKIKERVKDVDIDYLMAGSIAPDSGGKELTHFYKGKNEDQYIDLKCFYNRHLRPENLFIRSDKTRSFYWGYYFHLIVDNLWNERYYKPMKKDYKGGDNFTYLFKQEMEALDYKYLEQHPQDNVFAKFKSMNVNLEFFNDFPPKLIYEYISKMNDYYSSLSPRAEKNTEFLDMKAIDEFIETAVMESIKTFYK